MIDFKRLLSALLLTVLVAGTHYGIWGWANQATLMADSKPIIKGFAYAAYRRHQSPMERTYPSREELAQDLDQLSALVRNIRVYTTAENTDFFPLAAARGLNVTAGAWLDRNRDKNEREIDQLISTAQQYPNISRVIVGNESMLREDVKVEDMIHYLDRVRFKLGLPVSTAEPWHVWLRYPELAKHVDFLTVHLLPYHEGVPIEEAVTFALKHYFELRRTFPDMKVVIGEVGWPSRGPDIRASVASPENQVRFIREWLNKTRWLGLDYFLMEAYDQPWKVDLEGWAGPYWGMFDADRKPKFSLTGPVINDASWQHDATMATSLAVLPIFLLCFALRGWHYLGKLWLSMLVQASATALVIVATLPVDYYFSMRDVVGLAGIIACILLTIGVLITNGFEFAEVLFKKGWKRAFTRAPVLAPEAEPFVSVHLACCNEPPDMVIATVDSLARMDYRNFEVIVVDNNTKDETLWKPVEAHIASLGPNFRFYHLPSWPGFKAGALNFALEKTDPRAEVVGVVDADYVVTPDWLAVLTPHFGEPQVAVVQAPQAHRDWERHPFRRMCNWEFDGFFHIGMHHRHERNALIQHGTMTLVRKPFLADAGGWSEWCICEDTELGLRLLEAGHELRYIDEIFGRGLTPSDFKALKSQRFRWAFGAMQILKAHRHALLGASRLTLGQRYHFLTGWFSWFGDALELVFAVASLIWTALMLFWPKVFFLPVTIMLAPVLGLLFAKAAMGPFLYRRTTTSSWMDILLASVASLGLSHAIARGVFAGLSRKKGEFKRTAKGRGAFSGIAFIDPIREEMGLLLALIIASIALLATRGTENREALLWVVMLALEMLPYLAALACQIIAHLPERGGAPEEPISNAPHEDKVLAA